ncbi:branched-chain amino acid ABC transporter permease [Ferviditalea candida]|uniref:Branched-chain amino acid ABC transporter permease n=1 Tax=Ferviditalea candida TaxID=3108399 RepID=A0ABU5ZHY5_9BACL|nr:branched-chain amino acid ABC transporter permease [Paenibacillaceae bacterium T2]
MKFFMRLPKFSYVLLGLLLLTLFTQSSYFLDIIIISFIWAAAAGAWNISGGYAGQFSLGHAGYLGVGAYTSTLLYIHFGLSPWIGMIVGGILAAVFAFVIGVVTFRLKGPFFTLSTIAFAELVYISVTQLRDITQGAMGLSIPFDTGVANFIFNEPRTYAVVAFVLMVLGYIISYVIQTSKLGYYLIAMREDTDAAQSLGVNITFVKLFSTSLSAFLTAIAGTFMAQYIMFIEPENILALSISIQIAMFAIVGGMNDASGPIIGALLLSPLGIFLRGYATEIAGLHLFIYGLILVLVVLYQPNGIVAGIEKLLKRKASKADWRGQDVSKRNIA